MFEEIGTLHIYGQGAWHDDTIIAGTEESLLDLKAAIDNALYSGATQVDFFCNDGEGYSLRVVKVSNENVDNLPVPYTVDYAAAPVKRMQEFYRKVIKETEVNTTNIPLENWHVGI